MLEERFPVEEVKTAQGLCRFTEDTLVLEERLYHLFTRLIEYNKNWGGVFLLSLGMMMFTFFAENPLTIPHLLSFLGFLGKLVLFAFGLGLLLGIIALYFMLDRLPSNLVRRWKNEIPLKSITQVTSKDLGVGIPRPTILIGYRESDSQLTAVIRFHPGMNGQFESTVALFEQREFQVEE